MGRPFFLAKILKLHCTLASPNDRNYPCPAFTTLTSQVAKFWEDNQVYKADLIGR